MTKMIKGREKNEKREEKFEYVLLRHLKTNRTIKFLSTNTLILYKTFFTTYFYGQQILIF